MAFDLYKRIKEAGCQIDSHQSDLYVLKDERSTAIIAEYKAQGGIANEQTFRSDTDHKIWYDLPFHYTPYWEKHENTATSSSNNDKVAPGR
jgi:hypothetical protein